VLVPGAVADLEAPIRLAEAALSKCSEREKSDVLNALGAALYRAGRFEESIRRLNESSKTRRAKVVPKSLALLAMAHHRLGHQDDAKHWLDSLTASQVNKVPGSSWEEIEIRILRREAESQILGSRPAASPSTATRPDREGNP
jgi:hypothetical protein